jgi:hypothetical protein
MIQAADYRRRAEDCAQKASEAQDDYHRNNYQQLADMWREMAEKSEGRDAFTRDEVDDALATIQGADPLADTKRS